MTEQEKDELLLTQIALMFQTAALQQMGKLGSPVTGLVERDLDQARISIDILDVLHRRMKGNLSAAAREADLSRLHLRMLARRYGIAAGADKDE